MNNLVPIQITIQAANAAEARQLINDLAGTMATIKPADVPAETTVSTVEAPVERKPYASEVTPTKPPVKAPVVDKPAAAPVPSDVELRALASEKAKSAGRDKVKALLDKYGAASVTAVPDESRAAFKADLEALT